MDKPIKKLTSFKKLPPISPASKPETTASAQNVAPAEKMSSKVSLTEFEKQALSKLGVEGDVTVLPANIAEKIESVGVGLGDTINFDDLPEDKKKEIAEFIKQAPDTSAKKDPKQFETVAGGVNIPKTVIIDDLAEMAQAESGQKRPETTKGSESKQCPHCGWDTSKKEVVEITDDDKFDFVQSVLGGQRFKKVYHLFGGKLRIVFRTLTTVESDMAYKQIIIDAQKDINTRVIGDTSFYWKTLMAYRAVMAVEKVESDLNMLEVPPIAEIDADPVEPPNTKVYGLFENLVEQIMPNEAMRNAIAHTYSEFNDLCEKLQSMAESKDFWNAIK